MLLRENTDQSQGKAQVISNINACGAIVETIKTTLGPCGMDKMVVTGKDKVTISNDGATIMRILDIVHPAARTLVDIAKSQDAEGRVCVHALTFPPRVVASLCVFVCTFCSFACAHFLICFIVVGDGTTSVVVLAGEFLKQAKQFVQDGVHPQTLIKGYRKACELVRPLLTHFVLVLTCTFCRQRKRLDNLPLASTQRTRSKLHTTAHH